MTRPLRLLLTSALLLGSALFFPDRTNAQSAALPSCEWCGTGEAPDDLDWETTIAGPDEPGERLTISGTVYESDGTTPAPSVVLYLYHTNDEGIYPKRGDETGNAQRHGYLRSWVRTDEQGRYRIHSIRPAAYPGRSEPAHIHITVQPPDADEFWIDSIVFDDDPLLTAAERASLDGRGGSGIVALERDDDGRWLGTRDIVLME